MTHLILLFTLGCTTTPDSLPEELPIQQKNTEASSTAPRPTVQKSIGSVSGNMDVGQQHPPLPADNPAWDWDAQSFVPDFGWYGEHNWTDVRMRVVGHMAMGYRDLARSHLLLGNWDMAIQTYQDMVHTLTSIDTSASNFAEEIKQVLLQASKRDVQILQAIHSNTDFPATPPESLIHWRIEYWKLLRQPLPLELQQIETIQKEIQSRFATPSVSKIDEFANFTDRHKLRSELFEAYAGTVDPLLPTDVRWGYWRPTEIQRQANALLMALEMLKLEYEAPSPTLLPIPKDWWLNEDSAVLTGGFYNQVRELHTQNAIFTPSYFSHRIRDQKLDLSAEQLGRLPTGDSIIDVGGQPGPMGIGTLMKLDSSDPEHKLWLQSYSERLSSAIQSSPNDAVAICKEAISTLDAYTHGSRFYNVKQFRNACTRQLARLGHYSEALSLFQNSFPLHHQDWACPNREGLLLVIIGRLEVSDGTFTTGIATLERSIQASKEFIDNVSKAEEGLLTTPKPPMMSVGGIKGPTGKPPMGNQQQKRTIHGPPNGSSKSSTDGVQRVHTPHKAGTVPSGRNPSPPAQ